MACNAALSSLTAQAPVQATPEVLQAPRLAERSVFEASVVDVGVSPGFGSGCVWSFQTVTYLVTKIVNDPSHRLAIDHLITVRYTIFGGGARLEDGAHARLDPKLFAVGAALVVPAAWNPSHEGAWSEGYWVAYDAVPNDAAHRAQRAQLVSYPVGAL
jgi:hypothetical protein